MCSIRLSAFSLIEKKHFFEKEECNIPYSRLVQLVFNKGESVGGGKEKRLSSIPFPASLLDTVIVVDSF